MGALHTSRLLEWADSSDPRLLIDDVFICQVIQMALSTILATIPILKSFVKSFDTGFGLQTGLYTSTGSSAIKSRRFDTAFELSSFGEVSRTSVDTRDRSKRSPLNAQGNSYSVKINKGRVGDRRNSANSGSSQAIMVQKAVYIDV